MPRKSWLLVVVLCLVVVASPSSPSDAATPNPLTVAWIEPLDSEGRIVAERIAADGATVAETWRLNLDLGIRNGGSRSVQLERITIGYPNAPVTITETTYENGLVIAPGKVGTIAVPEDRELPFPIPPAIRITLYFGSQGLFVAKRLVEHATPAPGGGYLFPGRRQDLPDGWYWADGQNHVAGTDHRLVAHQRFAYDFGVRRWDGKSWTNYRDKRADGTKPDGSKNEDYLIFGLPVHAVASGTIVKCRRDKPENPPGEKLGQGNGLWIQTTGSTEHVFYAHLKKDSISKRLCPKESGISIPVTAGEYLGAVGNSGSSSNPHLHIEAYVLDASGASQGRPMHFRNIRTRDAGPDWDRAAACNSSSSRFAVATRASVGWRQLVEPLWPDDARELARHGMREACFQDFAEGAGVSGYKPTWFDGYDVDGKPFVNVVFRRSNESDWTLRHNLGSSAYQAELTALVGKGYLPTLVESFRIGDSLRFGFLAEKRSSPGFAAYHGVPAATHQKRASELSAAGYAPRSVAVVSLKGKLYYTALWEKADVGSWKLASTLTTAAYRAWLGTEAKEGRRLVYLNAYHHDGKARFSAIVSSKTSTSYAARDDLSAATYQTEWKLWTGKGRRTEVVTGYRTGSSHRFAALWR